MPSVHREVVRYVFFCMLIASVCGALSCAKEEKEKQAPPDQISVLLADLKELKLKSATPGTCGEGYSGNCDSTNTCLKSGGTCTIDLAIQKDPSSGVLVATATVHGKTPDKTKQPYLCIQSGTQMVWQATQTNQQFTGDFGAFSPWASQHPYLAGNTVGSGKPDKETAVNVAPGGEACYKYDLIVCPTTSMTANLECGIHDPKIIIGGDPPSSESQK